MTKRFLELLFLVVLSGCSEKAEKMDVTVPEETFETGEISADVLPSETHEEQLEEVSLFEIIDIFETEEDTLDALDIEEVQESPFIESPELFLKILGPSSDHYASSAGSLISVTGIMFGEADEITWTGPNGSGSIEPNAFWLSDAIPLNPGDNLITVTAKAGATVSTDWILVVYTPGFVFTQRPMARPDVVFTNESTSVVFTIRLGSATTIEPSLVSLYETLPDYSPGNALGQMLDDGKTSSSGDEIANDGVFSTRMTIKCTKSGVLRYRAGIQVKTGVTTYIAYSPPVEVECVEHLTTSDCQAVLDTQKAAANLYETKEKELGEVAARKAVLDYLSASSTVKTAGMDDHGVWAQYKSGILGVLSLGTKGLRSSAAAISSSIIEGDEIASKKVVLFAPYSSEFGQEDEVAAINQILTTKLCPTYDVSGPHNGPQATLARLRDAMGAGILVITTHGDTFFRDMPADIKKGYGWSHNGSQEILFMGEQVSCSSLLNGSKTCSGPNTCPAGTECVITSASGSSLSGVCVDRTQADLRTGRVAIGNGNFAVLPSFFERYGRHGMPDSLVYLGACRSVYNGTLAAALLGAGAHAVAGFSDYVSSSFASEKGRSLFKGLVEEEKTTGIAFPSEVEDPDHKGSRFVLIGSTGLTVTNSMIVNEGFERGDLTGWSSEGDGRVITKLGITKPVSGKFMGIISTGLGFTVQTGLIEQTFCIPPGVYGFSFYWKFYSEEFHEFCGSQYQDTFQARFVTPVGKTVDIVNVAVDDLCDPGDCYGCCESGKCVGLVPSDVQFDIGDTHVVPKWQKAKIDVKDLVGAGPITLSFFATDKGDSIYDTVILIDALKFF